MDGCGDDENAVSARKILQMIKMVMMKNIIESMMDVAVGRRHLGVSRTPCVAAGNVPPV